MVYIIYHFVRYKHYETKCIILLCYILYMYISVCRCMSVCVCERESVKKVIMIGSLCLLGCHGALLGLELSVLLVGA